MRDEEKYFSDRKFTEHVAWIFYRGAVVITLPYPFVFLAKATDYEQTYTDQYEFMMIL